MYVCRNGGGGFSMRGRKAVHLRQAGKWRTFVHPRTISSWSSSLACGLTEFTLNILWWWAWAWGWAWCSRWSCHWPIWVRRWRRYRNSTSRRCCRRQWRPWGYNIRRNLHWGNRPSRLTPRHGSSHRRSARRRPRRRRIRRNRLRPPPIIPASGFCTAADCTWNVK